VKESGKPEAIHDQIVQWKLRKAYSEFVLIHQTSIMDDSKSVGKLLEQSGTTVTKFIRLAI
jgi:translation elongation factor EF-Ts